MSETKEASIHREFELERMILFSDAVFAIAITLLIIEIKFPELPEDFKVSLDLWKMFKPTVIEFLGFFMSFFFIGVSWARHLKMFRYLKAYDNGVIFRNLLSLMFIVSFPFSTSALIHARPSFMFPVIIYMGNLVLIFLSNFLLSYYIFKHKPSLSIPGHEAEKKYIHLQSTAMAVGLLVIFFTLLTTALLSNFNNEYMLTALQVTVLFLVIMRLWIRKNKPKKVSVFEE
ncbi:MAG: TMEM175 family protein [Bacteroidota bacterium]